MQHIVNQVHAYSDETLVQKVIKGDTGLFETLIRKYNGVLYKIARSFGFNHQDAEDLMQDTHLAAYTALGKFEGRSSYKTWICRIMANKCIYKTKYGYSKNEIASDQVYQSYDQPMQMKNANQTEQVFLNRELANVLEASLQNIPSIYRSVFVLREVEGLSVAETADILSITGINVKVRLNRAKLLLQKQIEQFYSGNEIYSFNLIYCDAMVCRVYERINSLNEQQ